MLVKNRATLRHHLETRPLCLKRDKGDVVCARVSEMIEAAVPKAHLPSPFPHPETDALEFYFTNHVVGLIRSRRSMDEVLTDDEIAFLDMYHRINNKNLINIFHYVTLIIHREMRHFSNSLDGLVLPGPLYTYIDGLRGGSSSEGTASRAFGNDPPNATFGALVEAISRVYNFGTWHSGSYGGKAWGNIADCLYLFVTGKYTGEMFLDTVWTLCHNTGPIFNKGMVYKNYTSRLVKILDWQAAGKIPQMLNAADEHEIKVYVSNDLAKAIHLGHKLFPKELAGTDSTGVKHKNTQKKHKTKIGKLDAGEMYSIPGLLMKAKEKRDGKK